MLWLVALGLSLAVGCGGPPGDESSPKAAHPTSSSQKLPPTDSAPPIAAPQARAILKAAIRSLENRQSVSAKIRQQVNLFDQQLVGSGDYFQQRTAYDPLIRLELRIQVGDRASSLLQVASPAAPEGRFLWTVRKMPDEDDAITRLDLDHVAAAARETDDAVAGRRDGILGGIGGLPRLLEELQATFDFSTAEPGVFSQITVWRLRGQWRPERLAQILPEQAAGIEAGKPANLSGLPRHLPDEVVLLLGYEDLLPRRIEYRRAIPADSEASGQAGHDVGSRSLVTIELFEVRFDVPIDQARFIYDPGDADFADVTDEYLESIGAGP